MIDEKRINEIEGMQEYLDSDPVAKYIGQLGKVKIGLTYFIRTGTGRFKESFTEKEAQCLKMGRRAHTVIHGRVPAYLCLDELADHFGIDEQELEKRIAHVVKLQDRIKELS